MRPLLEGVSVRPSIRYSIGSFIGPSVHPAVSDAFFSEFSKLLRWIKRCERSPGDGGREGEAGTLGGRDASILWLPNLFSCVLVQSEKLLRVLFFNNPSGSFDFLSMCGIILPFEL